MDRIDRSRNRGDPSTLLGYRIAERRAPPLHVAYSKKHVQNQYAGCLANFNRHGAVAAAAAAVCAFSASSWRGLIGLAASSPLLPALLPPCLADVAADERSPSCVCVVRPLLATRSGTRFRKTVHGERGEFRQSVPRPSTTRAVCFAGCSGWIARLELRERRRAIVGSSHPRGIIGRRKRTDVAASSR